MVSGKGQEYNYDVFVSYSQEDAAWVENYLIKHLEAAKLTVIHHGKFLLGKQEIDSFQDAISRSKRTILVISPAYLSENKNIFVDLLAQHFGYDTGLWSVIPIIRRPVKSLPIRIAQLNKLDMTNNIPADQERKLKRLLKNLGSTLQKVIVPKCPYPGLRTYGEEDANYFFGRTSEVEQIRNKLTVSRFAMLIGPSGCGKSSLVYAGFIPDLRRDGLDGHKNWKIKKIRPTELSFNELVENNALFAGLFETKATNNVRCLLFIDQFEEIFNCSIHERELFLEAIFHFLDKKNHYIISTIRADFYSDLYQVNLWKLVKHNRIEVAELDETGLREAIIKPADMVDVAVEGRLVDKLVADARGGKGILPFMQEAMRNLWGKVQGRYLSLNAYESLVLAYKNSYGENASALEIVMSTQADQALNELTPQQEEIARRIFLQLINFGEGHEDTRRQQLLEDLIIESDSTNDFNLVKEVLVNRRLIILTIEKNNINVGKVRVDISHEILINSWKTLKYWIHKGKEGELIKRYIKKETKTWLLNNKNNNYLMKHNIIESIYSKLSKYDLVRKLNKNEKMFLNLSKKRENPGWNKKGLWVILTILLSFISVFINWSLWLKINTSTQFYSNAIFGYGLLFFSFLIILFIFYFRSTPAVFQKISNSLGNYKGFIIFFFSFILILVSSYKTTNIILDNSKCESEISEEKNTVIYAIKAINVSSDEANVFSGFLKTFLSNKAQAKNYDKKTIHLCSNKFHTIFSLESKNKNTIEINQEKGHHINHDLLPLRIDTNSCEGFYNSVIEIRKLSGRPLLGLNKIKLSYPHSCSDLNILISAIEKFKRNLYLDVIKTISQMKENKDPVTLGYLSIAHQRIGNIHKSIKIAEQANIASKYEKPYLTYLLGSLYYLTGNTDKSIKYLNLSSLSFIYPWANLNIYNIYCKKNKKLCSSYLDKVHDSPLFIKQTYISDRYLPSLISREKTRVSIIINMKNKIKKCPKNYQKVRNKFYIYGDKYISFINRCKLKKGKDYEL